MAYCVITDIALSSDTYRYPHTGTIRLVDKGDIPLPKPIHSFSAAHSYDETYFTGLIEAQKNFELVVKGWKNNPGGSGIEAIDET